MAIRDNPAQMVMRLEEALIINDACAGELVTAAMDAVNADPALVRQIYKTAMDLAPERSTAISEAVKHYSAPTVVAAQGEEVRRAELPTPARAQPRPGEELRRAELPWPAAAHGGYDGPFAIVRYRYARPLPPADGG